MKKKFFVGFVAVLILYFAVPRVVDSVKFSVAQQRTYDFVQSFSVNNVNYDMTEFTAKNYIFIFKKTCNMREKML